MKTQKQISKLIAAAAMTVGAVMPSFAQSNLGSACGCPPVASRPTVSLSTLPGTVLTTTAGAQGWELSGSPSLTCDKTYILDAKVYVGPGQIINIQPGTVIKALAVAQPSMATALVIERGGKIIASGTEECPIVFTSISDPMDGTFSIANKGFWGGVVILGKAHNNVTLAANGPYSPGVGNGRLAVADGLAVLEGFATSNPQDRFGANINGSVVAGEPAGAVAFDNNDNSGILRYVSIRHSGAFLAVGNEINGLTLGSVGKGTSIEHIEIISCADDNIELFGGTVDLKYVTTLFGNDDMFDYDLGWTGKAQFLFGMKGDLTFSVDSDNGFEADSDDQKSNNTPRSHPVIYNATIVGNAKAANTSDNSGINAINAKELAEGEIYNSIFANYKNGFNMIKSLGTRTGASEAYHNWAVTGGNGSESLKVKCNTFVGVTNPLTIASATTAVIGTDNTQFTTTDMNTIVAGNTLPGFNYDFTVNTATNLFSVKNDVIPNPALSTAGCPVAPVDGFFVPAAYRGAFASTGDNWLSDWSYSAFLGTTQGLVSCPTDIDKDGDTDVDDFSIFAPAFGSTCN